MAKDGLIEMKAKVLTLLPNATFKVLLENGHEMIAYTSGKMRKNRIRVLVGDEVTVEFSTADITRGRVTFRSSNKEPLAAKAPIDTGADSSTSV